MATSERDEDLLMEEGNRFREFWELFKKQQRVVYFCTGFVLLAALIHVQLQTPLYMARGTLLIEKENRTPMSMLNQYYAFDNDWTGEYLKTQIRVLTSRSLARKVIEKLGRLPGGQNEGAFRPPATIRARQGKANAPDPQALISGSITGFLNSLKVNNVMETRLVEVTYVSPDPKLAAHSVNTLFDKFIEFNLEMKAESTKQASEFLTAQIEEMRLSLAQKEQELQEYGKRKQLFYIRGEDSTVVQKLADLNTAFTLTQIERVNREAIYRELKGKSYENYTEVRDSPLITSMKQEYSLKDSEYKRKSQTFQDSYPEMQRLKSQLEGLQKRINEETADIARKALKQAESEYQAVLKKENSLTELLTRQKGSLISSNANAIYYNSLKIEVQNMTNLLDFLTRKQKESMLSSRLEGLETSNIKVVDRAEIPAFPFSPDKWRTMILALLLGICGGIFLIYVLN
jgi:succinoglycan biosynthesis transport protein ExoP